MKLLLTVEIFSSFNLYELCQICDALKLERFNANQIIIQETRIQIYSMNKIDLETIKETIVKISLNPKKTTRRQI